MPANDLLTADTLDWLLEPQDPGVRYLVLRDLLDCPADDPELVAARVQAHTSGPIAAVLAAQSDEGYWVQPGPGYAPKYTGTVWALILLAQLGASCDRDERIGRGCAYLLDHTLTPHGAFSTSRTESGTVDCLQGNLCAALLDLGYDDPRLDSAFDWMARTVTGEGISPASERHAPIRYYAYKCGPRFACGANNKLPCAWGAVKVMLAFSKLPPERRTPLVERAIAAGVDFLLGVDPATADYPCGYAAKPSGDWWKFGFPVFYITDLLQNVEALVGLGLGHDARLAHALDVIRQKQVGGHWLMEFPYGSKTWLNFGRKNLPNKWVTVRALRVLKNAA